MKGLDGAGKWVLCRFRHKTHNADSRIMPSEIGGVTRDSAIRAGSSWPDAA